MKYLVLALCLGLFVGTPLVTNVQAEALNPGQVILADDHGTLTNNPSGVPTQQENSVTKVGCPGGFACP
ncbi:MAG: hypothetical protein BGO67_05110 [Alphaproteobacteria bacterium 41-28]|nr:MAG: hypothetical protein BGO67_05110 [Alphaproteobacteria bacterium 41-28]